MVENNTILSVLEGEIWKGEKSWKSGQHIVMNENFVKNIVMNEKFESSVMTTQYLERHSASSDQHMKKLMSLRGELHVMMQCCMREDFPARWNLQEDMRRGEIPR